MSRTTDTDSRDKPGRRARRRRHRVLVVDDSALARALLSEILSTAPDLEVVGSARDAKAASRRLDTLAPDVLTLDVEMPGEGGLEFLERLMRERPMPVVMVSALTEHDCETTLRALELGAVDFVTKPRFDVRKGTFALAAEIIEKVRAAANARVRRRRVSAPAPAAAPAAAARVASPRSAGSVTRDTILAIGASTGGTEALATILRELPADGPPLLIVQHMPAMFTRSFAERLDGLGTMQVREARDGDRPRPGLALLAPGGQQMSLSSGGVVRVGPGDRVSGHAPSVDVLFESCARVLGKRARGVLLTGMGSDGARGLLAMRDAGSTTLVQDEDSCVIFGMPKEALRIGAAERSLPIEQIARAILEPDR